MKKHYLIVAAIATLLATGCQKEQELVTLGAVISQTGKTYINDRYPCWNEDDQVYVNDNAYPISAASGRSGQIANVVGSDSYRALFPASLVTSSMDITNSSSIPITLPATQVPTPTARSCSSTTYAPSCTWWSTTTPAVTWHLTSFA